MSGFALRIIAMATMLTDHIGWGFLENPMPMTWIGRIAFPLYAFLLAEGFHAIRGDRERLNRHLSTMLILAVVSEPCYDLMDWRLDFSRYLDSQSNIITLLLGYAGMLVTEAMLPSDAGKKEPRAGKRVVALFCAYGLLGFANYMLKANFNVVGPWLVIAYYWVIRLSGEAAKAGDPWPWGKRFLIFLAIFACYLPPYFWVRSGFGSAARWWEEAVNYAPWIAGHAVAALILSLHNGELGYHSKRFSRIYLMFYPVHAFLVGCACILAGR